MTENMSLQASIFTLLFGYMLLEPNTYDEQSSLTFLFAVIFVLNVTFLVYWLVKLVQVLFLKYRVWRASKTKKSVFVNNNGMEEEYKQEELVDT